LCPVFACFFLLLSVFCTSSPRGNTYPQCPQNHPLPLLFLVPSLFLLNNNRQAHPLPVLKDPVGRFLTVVKSLVWLCYGSHQTLLTFPFFFPSLLFSPSFEQSPVPSPAPYPLNLLAFLIPLRAARICRKRFLRPFFVLPLGCGFHFFFSRTALSSPLGRVFPTAACKPWVHLGCS